MRLLFSYIFFLLLSTVIIAQTGEFRLAIEDHQFERVFLSNEISEKVLDFEDSKRDDAFGMLPVYVHRLPLNSENVIISASIAGEENIIISATDINTLADIDKIGDQFQLSSSVIFVEGKPYADITILPYRKGEDGTLEALVKGIVSYELTETSEFRAPGKSFVENSVLASGQWYRISTQETGIFKISYDELSQMGIPMSGLDPRKIRLFGNGNGIIPEKNSDERYDDLLENAIYVHGEEDGVFDEDDYILFYGQSSVKWNYVPFDGYSIFLHELNPYTIHSYYFINIGDEPGKRISSISNASLEPTVYVSEFTDYAAHENEAINILKTGREWYGETYSDVTTHEYSFSFPNICTDYLASLSTNIAAHSTIQSNFDYYYGDQHLLQAPISKIILGTTVYAWTTTPDTVGFYPESDDMIVRVEYDKPTTTSKGWMNYISLNVRRKLIFTAPFVSFRDHLSYGPGEVAEYKISGVDASLQVWDVTDPFNICAQEGSLATDKFTFRAPADEIREFIAFDKSGFHSVEFVEAVANQNLHGYEAVDYIIVSHPDYLTEAQRMISLHSMVDNMSGFIVTPQQVYNEFSSGKQDPSAIRDFIRMLYENADSLSKPKYLLLMGDASYDYMDRLPDNTNMVPAYQSAESLKLGYSFVTDDYFGLLDPGEGVNGYGKSLEIGIGRFPVHTIEQAEQMVDKVEAYLTLKPAVYGSWRNLVGFIADDEDQNLHFNQAEKLEYMIDTGYHQYNCPKIYLDAFPQESTPSGHVYPEVNEAIDDLVESGCLIVNYTGHGGERGWAHEGVLDIATIINWSNWSQLPLFITATCEFSRYDDPSMISAGEWVFLNPYGGGIGLLTTSRLAWADPNFRLNKAVYQFMFKQTDGEFYKVGDVVRLAKTDQNNGTNIKNFVLLGDPAMRLAYPELRVQTLAINGEKVSFQGNDTLKSMAEVEIHGVITDFQGDTMTDFNGILIPRMLDKDVSMSTLGNDPGSIPAQFTVLGQQLTSGKVSVNDGFFTFSMFMPQNMASNVGYGKISYYAYDSINLRDAHGYSRVKTGGVNPNAPPDNEGPELSMYMNNTDFVSGDLTTSEPVFLAYLNDEHGINFTGNGIGRDIAMTLDNDPQTTVVLNKLFDPDLDNYQGGWISYPLSELEDGMHTITLKAWDNMNISSERSISFEVNSDGPVNLTKVYTYPNPFTEETSFTFDHNKPGNSFDIKIDIFNINGQRVRTLYDYSHAEGLGIDPIIWDGTDEGGSKIGPGIYIYRMYVTDEQGNMSVQTSKLIFAGGQN